MCIDLNRGIGMKKETLEYLRGERNATMDEFILSRERTHSSELVYINHPELPEPLYTFWSSRGNKGRSKRKPKHTGGKKPYVMLMVEELVSLMRKGLPPESAGYLLYLAPFIEWGTGRLVFGRKKRQMTVSDIEKVFRKSRRATLYIIAELRRHDLIIYSSEEGYFVSRDLIKRGAGRVADKVQERHDT